MITIARTTIAATILSFAATASADMSEMPSGAYGLDKTHAYITFSYSHLGFSNPHVGFDNFDATLDLDSANPENSKINVVIDAASINSRVAKFDEHLNGDDFFDTANHPSISFDSTSVTKTGDNTFDVTGDLTIKGMTKPVTLAATINKAANHPMRKVPTIGISASTTLLRSDWGLGKFAPNVGDEVTIDIQVEMPQN
ncbi:MAG: YceI family protein [Pseudomonadota bacterium]